MRRVSCLVALLGAFAATAQAATATVSPDEVTTVFRDFAEAAVPGCAIGIFEHGQPRLMRGYGVADVETKRPLDETTVFYAASTSKQFTALSIAILAHERKLALNDDVRRWIPELPDYGTPITVSMLIHHTSGLADYLSLFELGGLDRFDALDPREAFAMIARQQGVSFTPGTSYRYSNSGYFLLAQIVARASGIAFPEFVRSRILEPLGMRDSFVRNGANPPSANAAHGYVLEEVRYVEKDTYPAFGGSGGLMTSVRDLQKFDHDFHIGHRIWSDPISRMMLNPGTFTDGTAVARGDAGLNYAAGLQVGTRRGLRWVSHGGAATAFKSEYVRLPDHELGIAVLCNRGDANPGAYAERIIETLGLGPLPGSWDSSDDANTQAAKAPDHPMSAELVNALLGRYRSQELEATYVFSTDADGRLRALVESSYAIPGLPFPLGELHAGPGETLNGNGYVLRVVRTRAGPVAEFSVGGEDSRAIRFVREATAADTPGR